MLKLRRCDTHKQEAANRELKETKVKRESSSVGLLVLRLWLSFEAAKSSKGETE